MNVPNPTTVSESLPPSNQAEEALRASFNAATEQAIYLLPPALRHITSDYLALFQDMAEDELMASIDVLSRLIDGTDPLDNAQIKAFYDALPLAQHQQIRNAFADRIQRLASRRTAQAQAQRTVMLRGLDAAVKLLTTTLIA